MQFYIYYGILVATSVASQMSVITSDNNMPEEIGLAIGPASVNLKLSETRDSEEIAATELSNSLLNSNELTIKEITPENITLSNEGTVLDENLTEKADTSGTQPGYSSIMTSTSVSLTSSPPSKATESVNANIITSLSSREATSTSILAGSSSITIALPTSTIAGPSISSTTSASASISTTTEHSFKMTERTPTRLSSPTSTITVSQSIIAVQTTTTAPPSFCAENEVYSCLPLCPRTCNNPLSRVLCRPIPSYISFCRRGCTCVTGYLYEKTIGKCVKQCPATRSLDG